MKVEKWGHLCPMETFSSDIYSQVSIKDLSMSLKKDFMYSNCLMFTDLVMIPCEFCGEPFDADDLVQHQVRTFFPCFISVIVTLTSHYMFKIIFRHQRLLEQRG